MQRNNITMIMNIFQINRKYTKKDIYECLSVPLKERKGAWDTGYRLYNNEIFIFANIGTSGRTGQNHFNKWSGNILSWEAKSNSNIAQPMIQKMLDPLVHKHVFTRTDNRAPFTYEGIGSISDHKESTPVRIYWRFDILNDVDEICEQEVVVDNIYKEGAVQQIKINSYERNPYARRACIEHYGYQCQICGFDYNKTYGDYAKDYIQVHHIIPISEISEEYILDPIKDLIPICANCHSVIHRKRNALLPQELKAMIKKRENG